MKYAIISAIDYLTDGDAVYRTLEGYDLPDQYRERGPECEHCGTNRMRKTVYILRSDAGEYRQVGSTCLGAFIGGDETELVAAFRSQLDADEDERGRQGRMIGLETYLSHVAQAMREYGWLGATASKANGGTPTATIAYDMLRTGRATSEADGETARAAITWAQSLSDDEPNDYSNNLHVLAGQRAIEPKHLNLTASMIVSHQRAIANGQRAAESNHFGTVGKREQFSLTVERVFTTEYGVTHIHTMRDSAGNVAVWFATKEALEVGRSYTLAATVKSHGERDGVKQTVLTRCKELQ